MANRVSKAPRTVARVKARGVCLFPTEQINPEFGQILDGAVSPPT
jgi:hypothetical protein